MHSDPAKEHPCSHQLRAAGSSGSENVKIHGNCKGCLGSPDPLPADNVVVSISHH